MPSPKLEILVPSWPSQRAEAFYGATAYPRTSGFDTTSDTTKMYFRARDVNEKTSWVSDAARAYQDICLYIYFDKDGTFLIDFRLCDIHTLQLKDAEARIKILKNLNKKVEKSGVFLDHFYRDFNRASIKLLLKQICNAIGVKRTVQYHGINTPESHAPVEVVINAIVDDITKRSGL